MRRRVHLIISYLTVTLPSERVRAHPGLDQQTPTPNSSLKSRGGRGEEERGEIRVEGKNTTYTRARAAYSTLNVRTQELDSQQRRTQGCCSCCSGTRRRELSTNNSPSSEYNGPKTDFHTRTCTRSHSTSSRPHPLTLHEVTSHTLTFHKLTATHIEHP